MERKVTRNPNSHNNSSMAVFTYETTIVNVSSFLPFAMDERPILSVVARRIGRLNMKGYHLNVQYLSMLYIEHMVVPGNHIQAIILQTTTCWIVSITRYSESTAYHKHNGISPYCGFHA